MNRTLMLALTLAGLAGCNRYEALAMEQVAGVGDVRPGALSVPEGRVLVLEATPTAGAGHRDYDALDELRLEPVDPDVVRVERGLLVDTWMVMGAAQGDTEIAVHLNDDLVEILAVRVGPAQTAQPEWAP